MGVEGSAPECQEAQGGRASREGQSGSPKPGLTQVIAVPLGSVHSSYKLIASFHECQHCSPWLSWRPQAVARYDAVRQRRGTPRQRGGWQAHDHGLLCSGTPEMYAPHNPAWAPHVARGEADQHNSQPVRWLICFSYHSVAAGPWHLRRGLLSAVAGRVHRDFGAG
jgi:hypothetical protein